ncbi:hypothetical protein DEJ13_02105 [Curtobacterium sp. MCLR17_007]|uniref:hypothetical protein n=1 Tax=Curtobacterium sp. MCLR17_007 TaxID=2175648 RepID=UPI0011B3FEF0|nr:hypothetical protein [Curtobacterium sp. MCLR17_007]WIB60644.1 hypothetical protein DEJ13_02105 [Curtobacterium sp. MCLR17_007]
MRITKKRSVLWTLPLGAVLLSITLAAPAHAVTTPDADVPLSSTLTITQADGTSKTTTSTGTLQSVQDVAPADDVNSDQPAAASVQSSRAVSAAAAPAVAGPQGAKLLCNKFYKFSDANLSYTVQHQCGGSTVPWGIKLSPADCATVVGDVVEAPQHWTKNGATQKAQSGHTEECVYQFHGNYSGSPDGTHIAYSGLYTWRVKGNGTATLQVYGSFTATGNRCGSATSC